MRAKKLFALLLAGSMMASVLTGCWGGKKDDPSSGTDGDSDITWTDPDYDEDEDAPVAEYTIAVDVGDYGTVKPASPIKVKAGDTATFTVTANEGWLISGIQIDNKDQPSSGPAETLKVSLDKVSANHTVTVKYEAKTFTVSATVSGGNGTVSPATQTVTYGGSASITVTPEKFYTVDTVTVKVGDGEATTLTSTTNEYTVNNVTGTVAFTVKFKKADVESYTITGTPTKEVYGKGESFALSNPQVIIQYNNENHDSETKALSTDEMIISPESFTETGKITVKVKYVVGEKELASKDYEVTVNYLNEANHEAVVKEFNDKITNPDDNVESLTNSDIIKALPTDGQNSGKFYNNYMGYIRKTVSLDQSVEEIKTEINSFYTTEVQNATKQASFLNKKVFVYMEIDEQAGTCTMWAVYTPKLF